MIEAELKKTPLFQLHQELGGKMVPFAGYQMPVQYPEGIKNEHLHTRAQAGLFDVSHMGQIVVRGQQSAQALERLVPVDLLALETNRQIYGLFTNEHGGILDDLIITRWAEDTFFLVVNAACKAQDLAHLQAHLADCDIDYQGERGLLALQGPAAKHVMAELAPQATELVFLSGCPVSIDDVPCYVTRSGYTGEDGFEISVPAEAAEKLARRLLAFEQVRPAGLGARDSLRLEAGLCLYGHDMGSDTTPIEAGLTWSISKARRADGVRAGGFPGAEQIFAQLSDGVSRKRVGLRPEGRAPVREGAQLVDAEGAPIGTVTSGGFGPTIEGPLAMGYVQTTYAQPGTTVQAIVRGKPLPVTVVKMPFITHRYFRG